MIVKIDLHWSTPDIHVFNVPKFIRKNGDIIDIRIEYRQVVPKMYVFVVASFIKDLFIWQDEIMSLNSKMVMISS